MERKREWGYIGSSLNYNCGYSLIKKYYPIKDFIEEITETLERGATHFSFDGDCYNGDVINIEIFPMKFKIESEADYKKRLNKKAAEDLEAKKEIEAEERAEYERLKLKYE